MAKTLSLVCSSIEKSMETLKILSAIVGKQRVAWRYDPVLLTKEYTIQAHLNTFEQMAGELAPFVDRWIFSFVEMYKKLETDMPELIPLTDMDKAALAKGMGEIAAKYGLYTVGILVVQTVITRNMASIPQDV